jgi:hypothetical protein
VTDIVNAYNKLEAKRRTAEQYKKQQNKNGDQNKIGDK